MNVLDQSIADLDPDIAAVLDRELARQQRTLEMIASENFVPRAVLQAQGSVLTNKYAEGYPGRRYYGGCEEVDVAEQIAIDRAKELFGAEHANVQPHSGASANAAVMHALARPGDKLMGLSLAHGGHLTHGMKINFSGRLYDIITYETEPETGLIDMDKVRELAVAEQPKVIVAEAGPPIPGGFDFPTFREIADEVGAALWVDMAHFAGLVAAGLHAAPSPMRTSSPPRSTRPSAAPLRHDPVHRGSGQEDRLRRVPGQQGGPLMHVIAAKAVALKVAATPRTSRTARPARSRARSSSRIASRRRTPRLPA